MPIKGQIVVIPLEQRLRNMELHRDAYLEAFFLEIAENTLFIHLDATITYKDDVKDSEDFIDMGFVSIRRIGSNLTEDDFEIDVTVPGMEGYTFSEVDDKRHYDLSQNLEKYLVFYEVYLCKKNNFLNKKPEVIVKVETLESLQDDLVQALQVEDYDKAGILREKIAALKQKI